METTIFAVVAVATAALALYLLFRQAEVTALVRNLKEQVTSTNQKNKKLQSQLQGRSEKLSKKGQETSHKDSKARSQLKRIEQQQSELTVARKEATDAKNDIKEISRELNRIRIDREQLRSEIADLKTPRKSDKKSNNTPAESARTTTEVSPAKSQEPGTSRDARQQNIGVLERDLDRARQNETQLVAFVNRLKRDVVERESKLRQISQKSEHNRRAYIITQLQLDLVSDEIYFLKHGTHPPIKQTDKHQKRLDLHGVTEEPIVLVDQDNPIDLIGVGARAGEDIVDDVMDFDEMNEPIENDEIPLAEETAAEEASEEVQVEAAASDDENNDAAQLAEEEPAVAAAPEESPQEAVEVPAVAKTTRLRRKKKVPAPETAVAPPRPL